jgi:septal ring factor EnvC (AmiA/AmiB activator)
LFTEFYFHFIFILDVIKSSLFFARLEETNSQVNKLNRTLEQKEERIKGLKSRLEDAVHQNNKLNHALELKDDKIKSIEDRLVL